MIAFFKDFSLTGIRKKLIIIYILNVLDIFLTLVLIRTGYFMEANPLMALLIDDSFFAIALKSFLPALLCTYLYVRLKKAADMQLKTSNCFIGGLLLLYTCINILHLIWLSLYYFT